jgi:hypothetical protein
VVISQCVPDTFSYLGVHLVNKLDEAVREVISQYSQTPVPGIGLMKNAISLYENEFNCTILT